MFDWVWLASLIGSLGAVAAAIAAWKSSRETRKTSLAQIIMQLSAIYISPEMSEAMKNLRWHQENTPDFAAKFASVRGLNSATVAKIDQDRRLVAHFFHRVRLLMDASLVDEKFIRKVVRPEHVQFLLEIVEPLEKAKDPNYDTSTYDAFRRMFPGVTSRLPSGMRA